MSRGVTFGGTGVKIKGKGMEEIADALRVLTQAEVLVGVPAEEADTGRKDGEPNNAELAYIHDNGAPEANIPQREFMRPGINKVRDVLSDKLGRGMGAVLRGDGMKAVERTFNQVGIVAATSIKETINEGIPPPLSDATLRNRMRKGRKGGGGWRLGAAQELDRRWDGQAPSVEFAKPLVDTAAMRNSVTYVIRARKRRLGET